MSTTKKEQELELWKQWKETGDTEPLTELLTSMQPLLRQSVNKYKASPLPIYALEAVARDLAVKAFETYDPTKAQLNTHTVNHLKHLQRYVLNYQNIGKIPETRGVKISRYQNVKTQLTDDLKRAPNFAELSDELQWNLAEVERMELELRSDLDLREGKEEAFFDYTFGEDDILTDYAKFTWFDEDNIGKKIIEHAFGIGGVERLSMKELSVQLNVPESTLRKKARRIAEKINSMRYT